MTKTHTVPYASTAPSITARWDDSTWRPYEALEINAFHPQSSGHQPKTHLKLCYDDANLYLLYKVEDQFVVARHTADQEMVCEDSCVEAFIQPAECKGYINFEANACGTMLASHITDPTRVPGGFKAFKMLSQQQLSSVKRSATLTGPIDSELVKPTLWEVSVRIPFALIAEITGVASPQDKTLWRANFFKCADKSSHPHWAAWSPIGDSLNFHQPAYFGQLQFGGKSE